MHVKFIIWHMEVTHPLPSSHDLTHKEWGPWNPETTFILQMPAKTDPHSSSISPYLLIECEHDERQRWTEHRVFWKRLTVWWEKRMWQILQPGSSGKPEARKIGVDVQRRVTMSQARMWVNVFPGSGYSFIKSQRSESRKSLHQTVWCCPRSLGSGSDQEHQTNMLRSLDFTR